MFYIGIAIGFVLGGFTATFVIALCQVQEDDDEHDREQLEWIQEWSEKHK